MGVYSEEEAIIIEKGKGSYLYDTNGNKYLDGYASLWVNVHGHNNKYLNKVIKKQLNKIAGLLAARIIKYSVNRTCGKINRNHAK